MQKVAAPSTVSELDDNFSWLGSARKPQVDELSHFKAPVRINRGKFPCDFFANLKERRASIKLRPLDVLPAKESDIGTPKFSSYASTIPKLVFGKLMTVTAMKLRWPASLPIGTPLGSTQRVEGSLDPPK